MGQELWLGRGPEHLEPSQPVADREPRLTITLGAVEFLKVISGNANPMMMFMSGKLKAKGDLALAANIPNYFNLPKG